MALFCLSSVFFCRPRKFSQILFGVAINFLWLKLYKDAFPWKNLNVDAVDCLHFHFNRQNIAKYLIELFDSIWELCWRSVSPRWVRYVPDQHHMSGIRLRQTSCAWNTLASNLAFLEWLRQTWHVWNMFVVNIIQVNCWLSQINCSQVTKLNGWSEQECTSVHPAKVDVTLLPYVTQQRKAPAVFPTHTRVTLLRCVTQQPCFWEFFQLVIDKNCKQETYFS